MGTHPIFESDFDCLTEIGMPKQIHEIKEFLIKARRKDAKSVKVKQNKDNTKFKVRCSKYLYTLVVNDQEKANKLKLSLPPGLQVKDIKRKKIVSPTQEFVVSDKLPQTFFLNNTGLKSRLRKKKKKNGGKKWGYAKKKKRGCAVWRALRAAGASK